MHALLIVGKLSELPIGIANTAAARTETLDKEPEVLTWSVGEWRYQMSLDIVDVWAVAT